ncbi:class I SAM-dependent methyltransferase [Virgibacillus oceani]|uniref:SAM-dependent methyltransferase n=1 Tax=Virgibacillus oceani TaxID=1479511 RepID=A0A917M4M0_9BACI|nr:class I SAM-dependent methyltransferase [Virgibacillus oceani]GGG77017.1 SAM-dependent methyltransferase [Virgibacillus oceani]
MEKERRIHLFDKQAAKYEKRRKRQSGNGWRRRMFGSVKGKTLEVAVGAGMNFNYFPKSIEYTGVDFSPAMLEKAKAAAKEYAIKSEFVLSEVENLSFPENTFDTIVSSGTLCSYEDPVKVLKLFNKWCKKDGKILLLEHGIVENAVLGWFQKRLNPFVLKRVGCHQDRDILEIVRRSSVEIVNCERELLGYLYMIWASPDK